MAPRSSWKGFIKLSLVSVPVKAFTAAATAREVRLNQLHGECNNRIKYQKTCPEHGEVQADQIVSGYEYAKGQYVRIDLEELSKLRTVESDKSVHIDGFVPADSLDPLYHAGRTYYLLPDGAVGGKPYALLHQAMIDGGLHAIAQVILAGREQLVMVRPIGELLAMTVLNHADKVKAPAEFEEELEQQTVTEDELELTKTLIRASTIGEFTYDSYKDDYREKLRALIEAKVQGEELVQVPDAEAPKIINLMEALKRSVAQAQLGTGEADDAASSPAAKKKPASKGGADKKMAPSKGTAARKRKSG